jgi:hypothetical protein
MHLRTYQRALPDSAVRGSTRISGTRRPSSDGMKWVITNELPDRKTASSQVCSGPLVAVAPRQSPSPRSWRRFRRSGPKDSMFRITAAARYVAVEMLISSACVQLCRAVNSTHAERTLCVADRPERCAFVRRACTSTHLDRTK